MVATYPHGTGVTVQDYVKMYHDVPDSRTELIHGEVKALAPMRGEHGLVQEAVKDFLKSVYKRPFKALSNGSLFVDEYNMPEPDVFVVNLSQYSGGFFKSHQVALVVEVSNTTLRTDLINDGSGKLGVYASAKVPAVWVIDVEKRCVHVFSRPNKKQRMYTQHQIFNQELTLKNTRVDVSAFFEEL